MKLSEILETQYVQCNLEWSDWERWISEVNFPFDDYSYEKALMEDGKIEWREHLSECPDGRRGRWINSFWFEGKPVFIAVASGRDGCEYEDKYVLSRDLYTEVIFYLQRFQEIREDEVSLDLEINELYGSPLIRKDFDKWWEDHGKRRAG